MQSGKEVKSVVWNIQYCTPPAVLRYCKKCGERVEHISSGEFRVNAQQKTLDIWLIYKCIYCNATWNSMIYSRILPHKLRSGLLERFHGNDEILAEQYAMDVSLLQRNGVEIKIPVYQIIGENISLEKGGSIKIQSQYYLPIKISSILRLKLGISQREFEELLKNGRIKSEMGQDLKKCRLSSEMVINISANPINQENGENHV